MKILQGKNQDNCLQQKNAKEGYQCIFLSGLMYSVFSTSKIVYPEVFLEECKYAVKEKKSLSMLLTTQKFAK